MEKDETNRRIRLGIELINPLHFIKEDSRNFLAILGKALRTLKPIEREVFELRYGWRDRPPRTLREIGEMVGHRRETVRQIEHKALFRIRLILRSSDLVFRSGDRERSEEQRRDRESDGD